MRGRDSAMENTNQTQNLNYHVEQDVNGISCTLEATVSLPNTYEA